MSFGMSGEISPNACALSPSKKDNLENFKGGPSSKSEAKISLRDITLVVEVMLESSV